MSFILTDLVFRYPGTDQPILNGLSVAMPRGASIALLGPSGSGKTTLLSILGLLWEEARRPGEIIYQGSSAVFDYAHLQPREMQALRLREFGFVLQTCYLLPNFTGEQNVELPLALLGWSAARRRERVRALLHRAGDSTLAVKAQTLGQHAVSLGQRQRLAVLRAIVHDPQVVFADEPTSNLDPENTERMLKMLLAWQRGDLSDSGSPHPRTLILVCHHVETAVHVADYFVLLNSNHQLAASFVKQELPTYRQLINSTLGSRLPADAFPETRG